MQWIYMQFVNLKIEREYFFSCFDFFFFTHQFVILLICLNSNILKVTPFYVMKPHKHTIIFFNKILNGETITKSSHINHSVLRNNTRTKPHLWPPCDLEKAFLVTGSGATPSLTSSRGWCRTGCWGSSPAGTPWRRRWRPSRGALAPRWSPPARIRTRWAWKKRGISHWDGRVIDKGEKVTGRMR